MLKIHFHEPNPEVDDKIEAIMDAAGITRDRDTIREMIIASLKSGQDSVTRSDLKMMNMTLKEMRYTAKVFTPYNDRLRVTIFGSARVPENSPLYKMSFSFGKKVAENGYMVITGGGPGIMEAANRGAGETHSFGVTIRLPFEQVTNNIMINSPRMIRYKYFFNRKIAFLKETHAIALFPGGFGTLDEATEAMTLIQTGKQSPMPILLLEPRAQTYWKKWMKFVNNYLVKNGYISAEDTSLVTLLNDEQEALAIIEKFYSNYHSIRYVEDLLVIRLKKGLDQPAVQTLNSEFVSLLIPGGQFKIRDALTEEQDEPEFADLPRLVFPFNKRSFARLKALIDRINSF